MTGVLVVDGGQSQIRARHSGGDAVAVVEGVSHHDGDASALVARGVIAAWRKLGSPATGRVVLGLTTAPTDPVIADRLAGLVASAVGASRVIVCDDTVTTHAGALAGEWGVSLAAGTGVACLAVPADGGEPVIIDGHGYLLGDDGGGFWVGREGLRAVLRHADGRAAATLLTDAARERFGDLASVHVRLHESARAVNDIAQFARDVLETADDDEVASAIVNRAVAALTDTLSAAATAAAAPSGTGVPVALGGRLLGANTVLRQRLEGAVAHAVPAAELRAPRGDALEGGLVLDHSSAAYGSLIHHFVRGDIQ